MMHIRRGAYYDKWSLEVRRPRDANRDGTEVSVSKLDGRMQRKRYCAGNLRNKQTPGHRSS